MLVQNLVCSNMSARKIDYIYGVTYEQSIFLNPHVNPDAPSVCRPVDPVIARPT